MRRALCVVVVVLSGCFYAQGTNGEEHHFAFAGPHGVAVGEPVSLRVAKGSDGLIACPPKQCVAVGGNTSTLTDVVDAYCDDGDCTIESIAMDGAAANITLHGAAATSTRLHIRARLSDGTEETDRWRLDFAVPTGVAALCGGLRCGHAAVFSGATWDWRVQARGTDGSRLFTNSVTASVDGDAVEIASPPMAIESELPPYTAPNLVLTGDETDNPLYPSWTLRLVARKPGVARVQLVAGGATRVVEVRVASPDEVADAELRGIYEPGLFHDNIGHWVDAADDTTFDPAFDMGGDGRTWAVRLRLSDGTFALGGAAFLRSTGAIGFSYDVDETELDAPDASPWASPARDFSRAGTGDATLTFSAGAITRTWPIHVTK